MLQKPPCQLHAIGGPTVHTGYQARGSTQEQLITTHIDFAILSSHVSVI